MDKAPFPWLAALWKTMQDYEVDMEGLYQLTEAETLNFEEQATLQSMWIAFKLEQKKNLSNEFSDSFEEWWKAFPKNDAHSHYQITRPLRLNKERSKQTYFEVLNSGISPEKLLKALRKEVHSRMISSVSSNNLKYMKNSVSYLSEGHYQGWIETDEDPTSYGMGYPGLDRTTYGKKLL